MLRFCSCSMSFKLVGDTHEFALHKTGDPVCFIDISSYWCIALSSRGLIQVAKFIPRDTWDNRFHE